MTISLTRGLLSKHLQSHLSCGGRYAFCPECDSSNRVIVYDGDMIEFMCEVCGKEVTAAAIPSNTEDLAIWIDAGISPKNPPFDAWVKVKKHVLKKYGCQHPKNRREQKDNSTFMCEVCGKVWDLKVRQNRLFRGQSQPALFANTPIIQNVLNKVVAADAVGDDHTVNKGMLLIRHLMAVGKKEKWQK